MTYSILHSQDGTLVYVNRFQEPAFFGRNEADEAIRQYSTRLGEKAQIKRLPPRRGIPEGILATWGKVVLEPLDNDSIKTLAEGRSPKKGYLIDFIGNFARSAKEGLPIYRISGGAGFLWLASFDPIGRGILRSAAVDPSASHPSSLPSDAGVTGLDVQPATAERASTHPDVVARQEAEKAAENAKSDAELARTEAETAKRDMQLAQTEIERLSAETAKLNAAVERLETDKNAVEGKARAMELVVYGAIIILIALLATISFILFVNRRRVIATKREGLGPEAKPLPPLVESPRASGGGDSAPAKTGNAASYSLNLAQSASSNATAPKSQNGSGAETDEERVTLPI